MLSTLCATGLLVLVTGNYETSMYDIGGYTALKMAILFISIDAENEATSSLLEYRCCTAYCTVALWHFAADAFAALCFVVRIVDSWHERLPVVVITPAAYTTLCALVPKAVWEQTTEFSQNADIRREVIHQGTNSNACTSYMEYVGNCFHLGLHWDIISAKGQLLP